MLWHTRILLQQRKNQRRSLLLPVVTFRGDETARRASVHVVLNTEFSGSPMRRSTGTGPEGRHEHRREGVQGHLRQSPGRSSCCDEVAWRGEEDSPQEGALAASSAAANTWNQPPLCYPAPRPSHRAAAAAKEEEASPSSGETARSSTLFEFKKATGVPTKTVISTVYACSCGKMIHLASHLQSYLEPKSPGSPPFPPFSLFSPNCAVPLQPLLPRLRTSFRLRVWLAPLRFSPLYRDLGALCLGPAASAAEAEEERWVRRLSGCSSIHPDRGQCATQKCVVNHKHNKNEGRRNAAPGGPRYLAMSDCLGEYPEILVQLLRGPLARLHPEVDLLRLQRDAKPLSIPDEPVRQDLCLWIGAFSIPRDDKRYRGGEDAWFFDAQRNAFGVADGVSEWEDLAGINPQEYAQDLMKGTHETISRMQAQHQRGRQATACCTGSHTEAAAAAAAAAPIHEKRSPGAPAESLTETSKNPPSSPADTAKEALTTAYHKARNFGSSTAIVGVLDGDNGIFGLANLGDSSCLILRRPRVRGALGQLSLVKKVKEMQHGFNVPYQFAHLPAPEEWEGLLKRRPAASAASLPTDASQCCAPSVALRRASHLLQGLTRLVGIAKQEHVQGDASRLGDEPSAIQAANVPVQDGDLILLGTDGLFDNIFDFEVLALTGLSVSPHEAQTLLGDASLATPPEDIARALALAAYWRSLDKDAQTPFSKEARRCCNKQTLSVETSEGSPEASSAHAMFLAGLLSGGKEDDITVAAAWVCRKDSCIYTSDGQADSAAASTHTGEDRQQPQVGGSPQKQERQQQGEALPPLSSPHPTPEPHFRERGLHSQNGIGSSGCRSRGKSLAEQPSPLGRRLQP
ncbi:protein phosphatase ptc7-like related protein [Cyclospora cayetanensis]|uniref:Protein phosphatase ptc7-like related protein n=1 Tax=Cyclospora cayetanensis TaxID=88456 RepID=A0A1D3D1N9_9EIME|nr:protein phosphatase ptc7-like related protein [Cyclospora cayetanensis]